MRLISFSPTPGYPSLNLHRYVYLVRAVQNCLHPFYHRSLEPVLSLFNLVCVYFDDHLVVADENRHGS